MTRTVSIRVVLDTNVLISAAPFPDSLPGRALRLSFRLGTVLLSPEILSEVEEVLFRPRFNSYLTQEEKADYLSALVSTAIPIASKETIPVCRDPRDDKFLELAVSGRATHIVSGDQDLLALHPFRGIPILSPRAFLDFGG